MMGVPKGAKIYYIGRLDLNELLKRLKEFQVGNKKNFILIENKKSRNFSLYDDIFRKQQIDSGNK